MLKPGAPSLRVFLIDDHPVVREGLTAALAGAGADDIVIVGDAATAAEGLAGAQALRPEVLLVDLSLPDRDGPGLIAALRDALPESRVVVLSASDDEIRVAEALRAGAQGYLLKSSPITAVVAGIREAAAGGTPLSPILHDIVLRAMRRADRPGTGTVAALTAREHEVLELFATGLSTREVAGRLGISPKTVETHRVRIYDKLGCRTVIELARIAVRAGIIRA